MSDASDSGLPGGWSNTTPVGDPYNGVGWVVDSYTGGAAGADTGGAPSDANTNNYIGGQNISWYTGAEDRGSYLPSAVIPTAGNDQPSPSPIIDFGVSASLFSDLQFTGVSYPNGYGTGTVEQWTDENNNPIWVYKDSDGNVTSIQQVSNTGQYGPSAFAAFQINSPGPPPPGTPVTLPPNYFPDPTETTPARSVATASTPSPAPAAANLPPLPDPSQTPSPAPVAANSAPSPDPLQTPSPPVPSGPAPAPYDPMADSPVANFLLYGKAGDFLTPFLDFVTNDANLHALQIGAGAVAVGAATFATGGAAGELAAGYLAGAGGATTVGSAVASGVAGSVAGGATFRYGVAALAASEGAQIDLADAAQAAFDPKSVLTDAAFGALGGLASHAAPAIAEQLSRLYADNTGSVNPGKILAGIPGSLPPETGAGSLPLETGDLALPTEVQDSAVATQVEDSAVPTRVHTGPPAFVVDYNTHPDLADNMWQAQQAGHPPVVTYDPIAAAGRRSDATYGIPRILSRDEYPFASTREGGPSAWIGHIPASQNSAQGGLLGGMYQRFGLQPGDQYVVIVLNHPGGG